MKENMEEMNAGIANRLAILRQWTGLSQTAFAGQINITLQRWNHTENTGQLSRVVAFKLVKHYPGLTLDWLFLGRRDGLSPILARELDRAARLVWWTLVARRSRAISSEPIGPDRLSF